MIIFSLLNYKIDFVIKQQNHPHQVNIIYLIIITSLVYRGEYKASWRPSIKRLKANPVSIPADIAIGPGYRLLKLVI
jgi:hypothetical protein